MQVSALFGSELKHLIYNVRRHGKYYTLLTFEESCIVEQMGYKLKKRGKSFDCENFIAFEVTK